MVGDGMSMLTKKQREEISDKVWENMYVPQNERIEKAITETERKVLAEVRKKLLKDLKESRQEFSWMDKMNTQVGLACWNRALCYMKEKVKRLK